MRGIVRMKLPRRPACLLIVFLCGFWLVQWLPLLSRTFLYMNDSMKVWAISACLKRVQTEVNASMNSLKNKYADGFYQVNDEDIYIYSAFLDTRFSPYAVRMFGMQKKNVRSSLNCMWKLHNGTIVKSSSVTHYSIYPSWPSLKVQYMAHQYSCEIPDLHILRDIARFGVYVPGAELRTTLPMTIVGSAPDERRQTLAVCVKAVWGRLDPGRLAEWVETNKALGVEKIVIYDRGVVGPAARVLDYFIRQGYVEVTPFTYILKMASLMADDPMRFKLIHEDYLLEQGYLVSINDCYYRLRDRYKYVLLLDVDEVLVPIKNETILSLIDRSKEEEPSATCFMFPVSWHFEEFGESHSSGSVAHFMYMQRHLQRTRIMPHRDQAKSIINTDGALTINWHVSIRFPNENDFQGNINMNGSVYGVIHHFRDICALKYEDDECTYMKSNTVDDEALPRMAYVVRDVKNVLKVLNII